MASPNLQLTGGNFQNAVGTVIANGTLQLTLSHDEEYVAGSSQVVAGLKAQAQLNAQGNIPSSPALLVYSNDSLLPAGSYYIVELFDIKGNKLWQQFWTLAASPNPLNVGTIVPISPPGSGLSGGNASNVLLQTNEVNNGSQSLLDLHAGTNVTLTDNGLGRVTVAAAGSASPVGLGSNFPFFNEGGICFGPVTTNITNGSYGLLQSALSTNGTNGALSALVPTATTPSGLGMSTSAVAGTAAGLASHPGSLTGHITLGSLRSIVASLQLTTLSGIRSWFGIGTVQASSLAQILAMINDAPNFNFVGFRYSTSAGDLKWQCVSQLDSVHQTTVAETGSHLDTGIHVFEIQFDGVNALFFIDGSQVGSLTGANLPLSSTQLCFVIEADNVGVAVAKQINCYNVRLAATG